MGIMSAKISLKLVLEIANVIRETCLRRERSSNGRAKEVDES